MEIQDMWCPSCAEVIQLLLLQEKGVRRCVVDYATDMALIEYAPRYISKEAVFRVISQTGYTPLSIEDRYKNSGRFYLYLRFVIAAFFAANVMMFAYPLYSTYFSYDGEQAGPLFAWLSLLASFPVVTYSFWPILRRFLNGFSLGLFGMETLVVLGVASSFGLSLYEMSQGSNRVYFDSMTVIIAFMLLGKIIESEAKYSTKEALYRLNRALPKRARKKFPEGRQEFVPLKEVLLNDLIIALSGEKIVLDGIVVEGEGSTDESLVTGEAFPVSKQKGSSVIAGSVITQGWLAYQVTSQEDTSTLKQILSLAEQGIGHKSQYTRAADPIVRWFVPGVILLAFGAAVLSILSGPTDTLHPIQEAVIRAVSVLLISCPCAIGIAAPLVESHLLNAFTKQGVIVRNRGCLKDLGAETCFVFDKTGTVTKGKLSVIQGLDKLSPGLKRILKGLVSFSNHPLSTAIFQALEQERVPHEKVEEFTGKGMKGIFQGQEYYLGSENFLREQGFDNFYQIKPEGSIVTVVYFGVPGESLFPIVCSDTIKPEIKSLLEHLQPAETLLLSGDAPNTVARVARACGFQSYFAHRSPQQKQELIIDLRRQGKIVCMVGDGINDAPALSAAHIGISVLSATDMSIQVSDIFLTTDKLSILPEIRLLAGKARRIIHQNLFWAFFYNVIGLGLAFFGWLSPIFSAFAMVMSSFIVIFNARRLK